MECLKFAADMARMDAETLTERVMSMFPDDDDLVTDYRDAWRRYQWLAAKQGECVCDDCVADRVISKIEGDK